MKKKFNFIFLEFTIIVIIILCLPQRNIAQDNPLQFVNRNETRVRIAFKYNPSSDMWIDFKKCGINSIMAIDSIYLLYNADNKVCSDLAKKAQLFLKSHTDWISPYMVNSTNMGNNFTPSFTGGWHNDEITGNPTARTVSYKVYEDGKDLGNNKTVQCKKADIVVINNIQGYNTKYLKSGKREIISEKIHYTIYSKRIDISTEIEALDNISIKRYYGLQTQNSAWQGGRIFYTNGLGGRDGISTIIYSSSGAKNEFPNINSYYLKNNKNKLVAWIDRKFGIGNMEYVSDNLPCAFTIKYGKSYFNLINGKEKSMRSGDKILWKGGYIFS